MTELITVQLLDLPLDLQRRASAHSDALQREFELIVREETDRTLVPVRLRELIRQLVERFGGVGDDANETLSAARARGDLAVSITYEVPAEVADACQQLLDLMAEADDYCRNGELMTLATPPDELAFRQWFLGEFIRQINGLGPRPWQHVAPTTAVTGDPISAVPEDFVPDMVSDDGGRGWHLSSEGSTARITFTGELDLESAPHLRALVAKATRGPDVTALVLDLSGVTFLDSVGLSVLLTARLRLVSDDVAVSVLASSAVDRVFRLAGVSELFAA